MDLGFVLQELRSELASVNEAIVSLEKLVDLRKRRIAADSAPSDSPKPPRARRASASRDDARDIES